MTRIVAVIGLIAYVLATFGYLEGMPLEIRAPLYQIAASAFALGLLHETFARRARA